MFRVRDFAVHCITLKIGVCKINQNVLHLFLHRYEKVSSYKTVRFSYVWNSFSDITLCNTIKLCLSNTKLESFNRLAHFNVIDTFRNAEKPFYSIIKSMSYVQMNVVDTKSCCYCYQIVRKTFSTQK